MTAECNLLFVQNDFISIWQMQTHGTISVVQNGGYGENARM